MSVLFFEGRIKTLNFGNNKKILTDLNYIDLTGRKDILEW